MSDHQPDLKTKVAELGERTWDIAAITARYEKLVANGIPQKKIDRDQLIADRDQILARVQKHAEEYNFFAHNCPQGTALALLEEFGLGNLDVIKALCPFPGIAGTGEICGGISGSLVAFGLFFGSDDITDGQADGKAIMMSQKFIANFEYELGYQTCSDIQEKVVFGRNMDPGASEANMEAFGAAKGFEKCGLAPGIGARLAAEIIIDSIIDAG
jgi:C_GCAxxG_C_C family probable redox protein